jgi:hypothetical protein
VSQRQCSKVSQSNLSPGRVSNLGPISYKPEVITIRQGRAVNTEHANHETSEPSTDIKLLE